tara:strand:+ start:518 stop:712 length:195 start_codon:yes stop_codon:yes gene_type:complete
MQKYTSKLFLAAAAIAPGALMASPASDAEAVITTAQTVFEAAAVVGISILGYRIVKGIVSRFSK